MLSISLNDLAFFSFHGVHDEERILGNNFIVQVSFSFLPSEKILVLEQTINYASVYKIIKQRMAIPTALLETLAQEMVEDIHAFDTRIKSVSVTIGKKDPPIPGISGSVIVNFKKDF
ncbi:MAG TPA: dihydroneopterin aldolase [Ferruginibacter sp.]|jgi:dihydroneopterin aldolase|nr:dihydroneopterin aldolase [Ferruginibacter sp.]